MPSETLQQIRFLLKNHENNEKYMEIVGIIFENPGNIVEPEPKSSALELNKSNLKQNRAPRA